ncbi:hypothetical protein PBRA_000065 [Plasmodiophora brassicae]|nr:hypothetical protein PBRA_000065 [Plasmodiophora brassicae]
MPDDDNGLGILLVIGVSLVVQFGLHHWQRLRPRSYHLVSLLGLWLFPMLVSIHSGFVIMLSVWSAFSLYTGYLFGQIRFIQPVPKDLPGRVYSWFSFIHRSCYVLAIAGYIMVLVQMLLGLGIGLFGFYVGFYGLYYGVLSRDVAEFTAERVVAKLGYYSGDKNQIPTRSLSARICALCDQELDLSSPLSASGQRNVHVLACGHRYHDLCLRGWAMVGKKDTCAYCREKIDLKDIAADSVWLHQSLLWGQILDAIRYLVAWNPVIFLAMRGALTLVGIPHL